MEWIKNKLFGEESSPAKIYYAAKVPNPKKGWLRKSALRSGDLWIDTKNGNRSHVYTGNTWRRLGTN